MTRPSARFALLIALVALLVTTAPALADTEAQLEASALALLDDYASLEIAIDNCPDGECSEAAQLEAELADLGAQLAALHQARAGLGSCGCQSLDALLSALDSMNQALRVTMENWDWGQ